jgi:hypothetical protein
MILWNFRYSIYIFLKANDLSIVTKNQLYDIPVIILRGFNMRIKSAHDEKRRVCDQEISSPSITSSASTTMGRVIGRFQA